MPGNRHGQCSSRKRLLSNLQTTKMLQSHKLIAPLVPNIPNAQQPSCYCSFHPLYKNNYKSWGAVTNRQTWYSILNWRRRSAIPNGHLRHCWKCPKWIWNRSRLHDHIGLARRSVSKCNRIHWVKINNVLRQAKNSNLCCGNSFANSEGNYVQVKTMFLDYR